MNNDAVDVSCAITRDDFVGILRTIWLFLENVGFEDTAAALRNECIAKGYDGVTEVAPKVIVVSPSPVVFRSEVSSASQITAVVEEPSSKKPQSPDLFVYCKNPKDVKDSATQQEDTTRSYLTSDLRVLKDVTPTASLWTFGRSRSADIFSSDVYQDVEPIRAKTVETDEPSRHKFNKSAETSPIKIIDNKLISDTKLSCSAHSIKSDMKEQFKELQDEHKKLMSVTMVLTEVLQTHLMGHSETGGINSMLDQCKRSYPDLFASPRPAEEETAIQTYRSCTTSYSQTEKIAQKQVCTPRWEVFTKQACDLDFEKLKEDLTGSSGELRIGLLQALRWRITQNDDMRRQHAVTCYLHHDLLNLEAMDGNSSSGLVESFLFNKNEENSSTLQEQMTRFLNTLASLTRGRDYLCKNNHLLVTVLIPLVTERRPASENKMSTVTRDMLIATLQKMSLRKKQRTAMISKGLLDYLISLLGERRGQLSSYCMEYSTALLMNLCLQKEAREILSSNPNRIFQLLIDLLDDSKHRLCMPYVNGAMYSILLDERINDAARRANLGNLLKRHESNVHGELRVQLQVILRLYETGPDDGCPCETRMDPEEFDLLEPELDRGDTFKERPAGEDLLKRYQLTSSPVNSNTSPTHRYLLQAKEMSCSPRGCCNADNRPCMKRDSETTYKTDEKSYCRRTSESGRLSRAKNHNHHTAHHNHHRHHHQHRMFRVPPSFTITIPMPKSSKRKREIPPCLTEYERSEPFVPKETSSAQNPPYGHDGKFPIYTTCYRESYALVDDPERVENESEQHQQESCQCCRTRTGYACGCYDSIKEFLDGIDNVEERNEKNTNEKNTNEKVIEERTEKNNNCDILDSKIQKGQVNLSYQEFVKKISSEDEPFHPYPSVNVKSYDDVFQSRPKVLRTPP